MDTELKASNTFLICLLRDSHIDDPIIWPVKQISEANVPTSNDSFFYYVIEWWFRQLVSSMKCVLTEPVMPVEGMVVMKVIH